MNDASGRTSGEILFLRVPPRGLVKPMRRNHRYSTVFDRNGFCGQVGERNITCFWIGMGRRIRIPGRKLLERIRSGAVVDIIDIGCAGALDSDLKRGDLVLGSDDISFDGAAQPVVSRGPQLSSLLLKVAADRDCAFYHAPIMTHERFVTSREERIQLFERTGCAAVQMEHLWFLRLLQSLLPDQILDAIRVTHLVLITDAVPRKAGGWAAARSAGHALTGYTLPGGSGGIMSLRRAVLSRWPAV